MIQAAICHRSIGELCVMVRDAKRSILSISSQNRCVIFAAGVFAVARSHIRISKIAIILATAVSNLRFRLTIPVNCNEESRLTTCNVY